MASYSVTRFRPDSPSPKEHKKFRTDDLLVLTWPSELRYMMKSAELLRACLTF
jgi:hypothetical protein